MGGMDAGDLDEMQTYGQPFGLGLRPGGILQGSEFALNRSAGQGSETLADPVERVERQHVLTTMFGADYARGAGW